MIGRFHPMQMHQVWGRAEKGAWAGAKERIVAFLYIIIIRLCQFMMEDVGLRLDLIHSQLTKQ